MLTENQRAFVSALARAPDDADKQALWRKHGCGEGEGAALTRTINKFLDRQDVQGLLTAERRTWGLVRRREMRDAALGEYREDQARAELQRVLVEEVTDAIVTAGEEIARGKLERLAAFAKVCEIGHKVAGATPGKVALTDADRRLLHQLEQADQAGGAEETEADKVAPAPDLEDQEEADTAERQTRRVRVIDVVEGIA